MFEDRRRVVQCRGSNWPGSRFRTKRSRSYEPIEPGFPRCGGHADALVVAVRGRGAVSTWKTPARARREGNSRPHLRERQSKTDDRNRSRGRATTWKPIGSGALTRLRRTARAPRRPPGRRPRARTSRLQRSLPVGECQAGRRRSEPTLGAYVGGGGAGVRSRSPRGGRGG